MSMGTRVPIVRPYQPTYLTSSSFVSTHWAELLICALTLSDGPKERALLTSSSSSEGCWSQSPPPTSKPLAHIQCLTHMYYDKSIGITLR
jgi:hypothetical protein